MPSSVSRPKRLAGCGRSAQTLGLTHLTDRCRSEPQRPSMWNTAIQIVANTHPVSAIVYLFVGVVAGGITGTLYAIRAHRPQMQISGSSSGGGTDSAQWNISLVNRPSFAGRPVRGEAADDLRAQLRTQGTTVQTYPLYWNVPSYPFTTTLEPGQQQYLRVFTWRAGDLGYAVVDQKGEPIARFRGSRNHFVLQLYDRLNRLTEIKLLVCFDDSNLQRAPELKILPRRTLATRLRYILLGFQRMSPAFRRY